MASEGEPWAQLICSTDNDIDPIPISRDIFVIGRAKDCDLRITDNKLVSGKHCYVQRLSGGQVILHDTSTNGTLLNNKTKICRTGELLKHGDEFHVVYKKDSTENNLGYLYQDLEELRKEASESDATQEYDVSELEQTISEGIESAEDTSPNRPNKRTAETPPAFVPKLKRIKSGDDAHLSQKAGPSGADAKEQKDTICEQLREEEKVAVASKEASAVTENTGDMKTVIKNDGDKTKSADDCEEEDAMAETLMCIICQEILHDCISLQPCMHSFCAGCYSDWMKMSQECPSCRLKVDRINKNHIVNNLVEAYLKTHPDKKRPEEDIKELEAKNTITRDMLYPKDGRRYSSDGYDSNSDEVDDEERTVVPYIAPVYVPPPIATCRQCPDYVRPNPFAALPIFGAVPAPGPANPTATEDTAPGSEEVTETPDTPGDDAVPSTSGAVGDAGRNDGATGGGTLKDVKVMPVPPDHVCARHQNHAICLCCMQPMPDRRNDRMGDHTIPQQQCGICYRFYCHAYWGCTKADCLGCISRFRDLNFGKKGLAGLINDNPYESNILKAYLESEDKSVRDMLQECVAKMERRTYTSIDAGRGYLNGETFICYACGMRNFKELAYQYRCDIPADQLPADVTRRADCYWGKNCRTQKNKPHHAQRFNHICDQIRTT